MAELRIATLNLLNNPHGRWREREPLVIEQGRALAADVYVFQEVDVASAQIDNLVDGLGRGYDAIVLPNPDRTSVKSLAVVTRLTITDHDTHTELEQGDLALRAHLEATDGTHFSVTTTHFHFSPTREGSECRRRQAEQLVAWHGESTQPSILAGDFNARTHGPAIATIKRRFRSAHALMHGDEPPVTHPTPLVHALDAEKAFGVPAFPEDGAVDYVFVDASIDVVGCALAWVDPAPDEPSLYPSDHYGLYADVRIGSGETRSRR